GGALGRAARREFLEGRRPRRLRPRPAALSAGRRGCTSDGRLWRRAQPRAAAVLSRDDPGSLARRCQPHLSGDPRDRRRLRRAAELKERERGVSPAIFRKMRAGRPRSNCKMRAGRPRANDGQILFYMFHSNMEQTEQFADICRRAFAPEHGRRWKTAAAEALAIGRTTLYRYLSGEAPVPGNIRARLAAIAHLPQNPYAGKLPGEDRMTPEQHIAGAARPFTGNEYIESLKDG